MAASNYPRDTLVLEENNTRLVCTKRGEKKKKKKKKIRIVDVMNQSFGVPRSGEGQADLDVVPKGWSEPFLTRSSILKAPKVLSTSDEIKQMKIQEKIKQLEKIENLYVKLDPDAGRIELLQRGFGTMDEESWIKATHQLSHIVRSIRFESPKQLFLTIPFHSPEMQSSYALFQSEVLKLCSESDRTRLNQCDGSSNKPPTYVDENLFQKPQSLFIKVASFRRNATSRISALNRLMKTLTENINSIILNDEPIVVDVRGIAMKSGSPNQCKALAATLKDPSSNPNHFHLTRMEMMINYILGKLSEAGYLRRGQGKANPKAIFNMTLMNTMFRSTKIITENKFGTNDGDETTEDDDEDIEDEPPSKRERAIVLKCTPRFFDAEPILSHFHDFPFVIGHQITEIHLTCSQSFDEGGFYDPLSIFKLT